MGGDECHSPVVRKVREVGEIGVATAVESKADVRLRHIADNPDVRSHVCWRHEQTCASRDIYTLAASSGLCVPKTSSAFV